MLGRPVLAHLIDLAGESSPGRVMIHARVDEHGRFRALIPEERANDCAFATGPPPEGAAILRTDRIYDPSRLRRALRRGRDPETAVIWRLDSPQSLRVVEEELVRRRTYQPLGRFWALAPARLLGRLLRPTPIRPNAVTLASGLLVLAASGAVALGGDRLEGRLAIAAALAVALVLDTADGHLARLQGTASAFGRWLDAVLDELGDMALHAAIAWSCFVRDGHPAWLLAGMAYGMGKYLFFVATQTANQDDTPSPTTPVPPVTLRSDSGIKTLVRLVGHADVRWHLWIVLAALGRLDVELIAFAAYFPARTIAGAIRKVGDRD